MSKQVQSAQQVPRAKVRPPPLEALWRDRLVRKLERIWQHRLGLLVGPAGSGKTTLLATFVTRVADPVAWFRVDPVDASAEAIVCGLAAAIAAAGHDLGPVDNLEGLVARLDRWRVPRALIVVDDLHEVSGTPAETTVEQLVSYLPPSVHLVVASRRLPAFNLPRLRVSGNLLEITPDDLRFRSWEVEELFRDFYNEPMAPEDLAALARRTGGWAAALKLFHLATRDKPPSERRRLLTSLVGRSREVRDYLSRNLLEDFPEDLRAFLVRTSVLGRLTPALCDAFLGTRDSARVLTELERRQLFTTALDDDSFRYHEVLRSHLESVLAEELGEPALAELCRRAGDLLFDAGYLPEALRAYWRAGHWTEVARVLATSGAELAASSGDWLEALSGVLVEHDPWLLLATARRQVALGRPVAAMATYQRADAAFGSSTAGESCRRERRDLSYWLHAPLSPRRDWLGRLRAAVGGSPLTVLRDATGSDPHALLTAGVAALCAGMVTTAGDRLRAAGSHPDASDVLSLVARVLAAVADHLAGHPEEPDLDGLADEAEELGYPWIARLAHGVHALSGLPTRLADTARTRAACRDNQDPWGEALLALAEGLGRIRAGAPDAGILAAAADALAELGTPALEAWAAAGEALACALNGTDPTAALARAESAIRTSGVRGPLALVAAARETTGRTPAGEARLIADECGLALDYPLPPAPTRPVPPAGAPPAWTIRCFGGFHVARAGVPVELSGVKPRARSVLQLLAVHAGALVHREVLLDALWPDSDPSAGVRKLHVAISSLRHVLDTEGEPSLIRREGDGYRLALPAGSEADLCVFEAAAAEARATDGDALVAALRRALDAYGGDLLPEAGPAEWVVKAREAYRMQAGDVAQRLATALAASGDLGGAIRACQRGLEIDRYRDGLWQTLMALLERAGEPAAAAGARRDYERVLAELGLRPPRGPGSSSTR